MDPKSSQKSTSRGKSLANTINVLIKKGLKSKGWVSEAKIFKDENYQKPWRLDFAKDPFFSVEVAFNHGQATAWNLLKLTLASEENIYVEKDFKSDIGIVIFAKEELRLKGGMDGVVITFEKVKKNYLKPLYAQLTTPILLIGLDAPKTFEIKPINKSKSNKNLLGMVYRNGERLKNPYDGEYFDYPIYVEKNNK